MTHMCAFPLGQIGGQPICTVFKGCGIPGHVPQCINPRSKVGDAGQKSRYPIRGRIILCHQRVPSRSFEEHDLFANRQHCAWSEHRPLKMLDGFAEKAVVCESVLPEDGRAGFLALVDCHDGSVSAEDSLLHHLGAWLSCHV